MTIAAVAVGGWKQLIPGLDLASGAGASGGGVASELQLVPAFAQAAGALNAYEAAAGSYSGAQLSPTSLVRLVWTGDESYCLQGGSGAGAMFEVGPGGIPRPGSCPPV